MADSIENFKFLPFKAYSKDSKLKISRKRHELDLVSGDFYPGEGHRAIYRQDSDSCIVTIVGGARHGEDSTWTSSKITQIDVVSTPDDIFIESIRSPKCTGSQLPPLSSPGFTCGQREDEMVIWGGLALDQYRTINELFYMKETQHRGNKMFDITMYSGSENHNFDLLSHVNVKSQIKVQNQTPSPRAGHSLNKIPDTNRLIMFGGFSLPNRDAESASFASPFVQNCSDKNVYILNLSSMHWTQVEMSGLTARCYHTADFIKPNKLAIVGGLVYTNNVPTDRLCNNSVEIISISDTFGCSMSVFNFQTEPKYISFHASSVFRDKLLIFGGYIQNDPKKIEEKNISNSVFVLDFDTEEFLTYETSHEYAVTGHSLITVDNKTILILSGSTKAYSVYTCKPFVPSPCDMTTCHIQDSPEVSPIQWIQCEGVCKQWQHYFCTGLKSMPRGKYICTTCSAQKGKKRKTRA